MADLIIGGAGFIGCNAAEFYAKRGDSVLIVDKPQLLEGDNKIITQYNTHVETISFSYSFANFNTYSST